MEDHGRLDRVSRSSQSIHTRLIRTHRVLDSSLLVVDQDALLASSSVDQTSAAAAAAVALIKLRRSAAASFNNGNTRREKRRKKKKEWKAVADIQDETRRLNTTHSTAMRKKGWFVVNEKPFSPRRREQIAS